MIVQNKRFSGIDFPNFVGKGIKFMKVYNVKVWYDLNDKIAKTRIVFHSRLTVGEMPEAIMFLHGINIGVGTVEFVRPLSECTGNASRVPDMENAGMGDVQY